jgi:hypothetical protein
VRLGYQAQPGSKLTAIIDARLVANCGDQRRCGNRSASLDLADALAHVYWHEIKIA